MKSKVKPKVTKTKAKVPAKESVLMKNQKQKLIKVLKKADIKKTPKKRTEPEYEDDEDIYVDNSYTQDEYGEDEGDYTGLRSRRTDYDDRDEISLRSAKSRRVRQMQEEMQARDMMKKENARVATEDLLRQQEIKDTIDDYLEVNSDFTILSSNPGWILMSRVTPLMVAHAVNSGGFQPFEDSKNRKFMICCIVEFGAQPQRGEIGYKLKRIDAPVMRIRSKHEVIEKLESLR